MNKASVNRQFGSIFLIIGTEIGAGILALPILLAHIGLFASSIILISAWAVMLFTALLICEINSSMESKISFASMAEKFLGKPGKIFIIIIFWCTLSSIGMAYISAAGSTLNHLINTPVIFSSVIFVLIFGLFIFLGTNVVDYANRILLSSKLAMFIIATGLLFTTIKISNLDIPPQLTTLVSSFPAIITAFILHNIIPSIRTYLSEDKKALFRVVIIGSLIPLILYILWVISVVGNIPQTGPHSFALLLQKKTHSNVGDILKLISLNVHSSTIVFSLNFVAAISITTSFLGTSISLYHFTQDIFAHKTKSIIYYHVLPVILTFIIPLAIVIKYPNIFITALSYAGIGATILFVLFPIIMIKILLKSGYVMPSWILQNNLILNIVFIVGIGIILIQFCS
ncbi:MAG TPA: aromatic amino acid transport family protein [Victivallales bacterium]|nr:aromatic amino acid transport family protein [Victivallales bacterium]